MLEPVPHTAPCLQLSPGQQGAFSAPVAASRQPVWPDGLHAAGNASPAESNSAWVMQRLTLAVLHAQVAPAAVQVRAEPSHPGPDAEQDAAPPPPAPPPTPAPRGVVNRHSFFALTDLQHSSPPATTFVPQKTPGTPSNNTASLTSVLWLCASRPQQNLPGPPERHVPAPRGTHDTEAPPSLGPGHWLFPPSGESSQHVAP